MAANSFVGIPIGLLSTTSNNGPLDPASCPVGTTIEAVKVTSR
jgi:hypothetical protein